MSGMFCDAMPFLDSKPVTEMGNGGTEADDFNKLFSKSKFPSSSSITMQDLDRGFI